MKVSANRPLLPSDLPHCCPSAARGTRPGPPAFPHPASEVAAGARQPALNGWWWRGSGGVGGGGRRLTDPPPVCRPRLGRLGVSGLRDSQAGSPSQPQMQSAQQHPSPEPPSPPLLPVLRAGAGGIHQRLCQRPPRPPPVLPEAPPDGQGSGVNATAAHQTRLGSPCRLVE